MFSKDREIKKGPSRRRALFDKRYFLYYLSLAALAGFTYPLEADFFAAGVHVVLNASQ